MRILITGAAGYIGSRLAAHLANCGAEVVAFDRFDFGGEGLTSLRSLPVRIVKGDVRDRGQLDAAMQGCDAVAMLAGVVGEPACNADPDGAQQTNRDAAIGAIERADANGVTRFIFFSTCSNYGLLDPSHLADEDTPLHPLSLYASTKVDVERFALSASTPTTVTVLRLGTICGLSGRMRFDLLVNDMARAAALGQRIELYRPQAWRPFLHVADVGGVVECVLSAPAERVNRRVFNVVGGNYQKTGLAEIARKYFPKVDILVTEAQPDNRDYRVSAERIERELGFRPSHTIEEAFVDVATAVSEGIFVDPMWPGYCATPLRRQYRAEVAV